MSNWLINLIGIVLIIFIMSWFWLSKLFAAKFVKPTMADHIDILVKNGVYHPALIKVKAGKILRLRFLREDPSPCAEWVIFPSLNVSAQLPLHQSHIIELKITTPGEYDFTCQMNMYRGKLIAE